MWSGRAALAASPSSSGNSSTKGDGVCLSLKTETGKEHTKLHNPSCIHSKKMNGDWKIPACEEAYLQIKSHLLGTFMITFSPLLWRMFLVRLLKEQTDAPSQMPAKTQRNPHSRHYQSSLLRLFSRESYLNRGCPLMASSGKNRDFETPCSTGVGRCSGLVKPGHPNLNTKCYANSHPVARFHRTSNLIINLNIYLTLHFLCQK